MAPDRVSLRHFAFVLPAKWIRSAEAAFEQYAASDDTAVLTDLIRSWDEEVDRERVSARVEPGEQAWLEIDEMSRRARTGRPGARRTVFRDPWEKLERALRRLARLEQLAGPEMIVHDVRDFIAELLEALDSRREPVGSCPAWEMISTADGAEIVDLSRFGRAVAELAAGAFPKSVGQGQVVERELSAQARDQLPTFARLDSFWEIHGTRCWEDGIHASYLVADPEIWAPKSVCGERALEIAPSVRSRSCREWRSLMPSVPVGDRGGPLFVRHQPGDGTDWWPVDLAADDCVVSFVLVQTPESEPFELSQPRH